MEAKDVRNLLWERVTDWSELSASASGWFACCVCETDVDIFVENIYRDISRKLQISYEQLEPVLKSENEAFYSLKQKLFGACSKYGRGEIQLLELQNTLRVPICTQDKVSLCYNLFEELSDIEKTVFLQKIGKVEWKAEE